MKYSFFFLNIGLRIKRFYPKSYKFFGMKMCYSATKYYHLFKKIYHFNFDFKYSYKVVIFIVHIINKKLQKKFYLISIKELIN